MEEKYKKLKKKYALLLHVLTENTKFYQKSGTLKDFERFRQSQRRIATNDARKEIPPIKNH
jgi:hypothetical protein